MFNAGVICRRCGQAGHFAKDCKTNLSGGQSGGFGQGAQDTDKEYQELMNEIGGGSVSSIGYGQPSAGRIEATPWQQQAPQPVASVAPWVYNCYSVRHLTNFYQKAAAPWATQQAPAPPPSAPTNFVPPPPPGMSAASASSFGPPPSLGPPPGFSMGGIGFPGGMPPPPMGNVFPPPPPGASYPPPPPPSGMYPPPPPPR